MTSPRYSGAGVTHVGIDEGHDSEDPAHLGVSVSGDHLEDVMIEVVQEGVELLLPHLSELGVDVHVEVLGGLVPDPLISALQVSGELDHELLLLLLGLV